MKTNKLILALAAILSHSAFGAMPTALPEFRNEQQLAEWRAEKAVTTTSEAKRVGHPFFTGKPFLASSSGYAFKYRTFRPELARWASSDPSGFPDGPNDHHYPYAPTSGLDPLGLAWMFVGSNHTAGSYSDTFSVPVDIDGSYNASVSVSGYGNDGRASSLTLKVEMSTNIDGWFQSAQSSVSKSFQININGDSGEVTMSGVTQFTGKGNAWTLGHVSSAYNAGIEDGENVVQGSVALGHGYTGWGEVTMGYEGAGLQVGVKIGNVDWSFPASISFDANKKFFE